MVKVLGTSKADTARDPDGGLPKQVGGELARMLAGVVSFLTA